MAPSLRDIRQAASKKRKIEDKAPTEKRTKVKEDKAPIEKRAVAKVPKRGGVERADTKRTEAAGPSHARTDGSGKERVAGADAGEEAVRSPARASEPIAPAPPITLLDSSPEQAAKAPSLPVEVVGPDTAHVTATPDPATTTTPRRDAASIPPATESPGAEDAASSSRVRDGIDPSFRSILNNHSRWAERALEGASVVEVQELLRHQRRATFFREASVAHLWALNTLIAMRDLWTLSDTAIDQAREEMQDLQARAERAEMALEDTRCTLHDKAETARLRAERAEYALEVAQRKAAAELDSALVAEENQKRAEENQKKAEEKLATAESELHTLLEKLHSTVFELNISTKKAERAEEAARLADVEIATLKVATGEAERRTIEAEGKIAAAEKRAMDAVENFRKSKAFDKELAESTAFAYDGGFQDCKEKVKRLFNVEGIDELEPDEPSEGDDPAQ